MRLTLLAGCASLLLLFHTSCGFAGENEDSHSNASDSRPNIVLILSDDQAWTDYGFMGHADIQTPHLDQLAAESLVFEKGYVTCPLCRPSLASMITGKFPFEHGVTGNDVDGRNQRAQLDIPLREAFHKHPSFVRSLTEAGYLTHQSGKWWEGSHQDGGFTHGMTHGDPKRGGRHGDVGLKIGRETMQPVKSFIDEAVKEDKPFFVWYAPFLPHTPHNPPARLLKKYQQEGRAEDVARYYATCEWFDETCGDLLNHLDQTGVRENTMVLYICDNGWAATSTNSDDPNQKQWDGYALRSKGSPFENGIRTPIMISWPGKLQPERSADLAHAIDLFPTIAAVTPISAPEDLPGINLLDTAARDERDIVFGVMNSIHNVSLGHTDETLQYLWCVTDDWKLLLRYDGLDTTKYKNVHSWDATPVRLYNVSEDPHETQNLADKHPEIVKELRDRIEAWHPVK
ncbi:MAG: sulfatase [Rubinisphaera brasiliensis]|uniref:sulfatase family protein n=1 Tax=Rubinisphaera brasiliensis TaxID=119 RepID=UPI00391BADF7